jgi:hypothetical protein
MTQTDNAIMRCADELQQMWQRMMKLYHQFGMKRDKTFIWGGCGGTVPFNTLAECVTCECAE